MFLLLLREGGVGCLGVVDRRARGVRPEGLAGSRGKSADARV